VKTEAAKMRRKEKEEYIRQEYDFFGARGRNEEISHGGIVLAGKQFPAAVCRQTRKRKCFLTAVCVAGCIGMPCMTA
jgi:hypothetical protein